MSSEGHMRLILPRSLDEDIKRRLETEELIRFLGSLDLTSVQDAEAVRYLIRNPERFSTHWTTTEANYFLYGEETDNGLLCTGYYFHFYNFFSYIDARDPEQATRKDICEADRDLAPHVHALAYNPEPNGNTDTDFLGTLHNHPHFGFPSRKRMKSVDAVGFSPYDERWNNQYLEKYGADGRKLVFAIYYSDNDFYMGTFRTKYTQSELLDIRVE